MKTKMRSIYAFLLAVAFGLTGCAVADMDEGADFSQYKTYAWGKSDIDVDNPVYDSDLINKRIRRAVEGEFARRGIVRDDRNPDFIVRFHTYTEEKEQTSGGYPYHYPFYPYGWYPFGFPWGFYPYPMISPERTQEYTEGTLILDIIDHDSNELVWRGSVSGNVDNVSALRKQIDKGIRAIMKKYPVTPDGNLKLDQDAVS